MPVQAIMGIENEYPVTVTLAQKSTGKRIFVSPSAAKGVINHIPRATEQQFMPNGGRAYIDTGNHVEYCTPECSNPTDVVRFLVAGDMLVNRGARKILHAGDFKRWVGRELYDAGADRYFYVEAEDRLEIVFRKGNIDYYDGATWGCHENYALVWPDTSTRRSLSMESDEGARILGNHLASRIILAGSGGFTFNYRGRNEDAFVLSPRLSLYGRFPEDDLDIFNDEMWEDFETPCGRADAKGCHCEKDDQVVRCWNGQFAGHKSDQRGRYAYRLHLKVGENTASQMSTYLKVGTTALVVVLMENGVTLDPKYSLGKRIYAASHIFNRDPMCRTKIKSSTGEKINAVDIQRELARLVSENLERKWMPPWAGEFVETWNSVLDAIEEAGPDGVCTCLEWAMKYKLLMGKEMSWKKRRALDTAFTEMKPNGLFRTLEKRGLINHKVVSEWSARKAINTPPQDTRAKLRGEAVKNLGSSCTMNWGWVCNDQAGEFVDLSNPFESNQEWHKVPTDRACNHIQCWTEIINGHPSRAC